VSPAEVAGDVAKTGGPELPFSNPPPLPPAELPLRVQLVSAKVPPKLYTPPPEPAPVAELPLIVQSDSVMSPPE
jgi:hypothetical protein